MSKTIQNASEREREREYICVCVTESEYLGVRKKERKRERDVSAFVYDEASDQRLVRLDGLVVLFLFGHYR